MRKQSPRLSDVARVASVSLATASRALSAPHQVRPATAVKVRNAAQMLSYVPHGAARALASSRSRTIGAVIPTLDNAIFATTVNALQNSLAASGFHLLLASHGYELNAEVRLTRALIERGVDGMVFVGTDHDPELYRILKTAQIPYVLTLALDPSRQHPSVGFDNRQAAMLVTRHLIDLGHERIAVVAGVMAHNDRARDRVTGVRDALRSRGFDVPVRWIVEKPYSFSSGREAFRELMETRPRPTGIVCVNDVLALGALFESHAMGIRVPSEVSITGFDDIELAAQVTPGITSVQIPTLEQGRLAASYLMDSLLGKPVSICNELPVELVIRGSTTAPPAS